MGIGLGSSTGGIENVGFGPFAMGSAQNFAAWNTGIGRESLSSLTGGSANTAVGYRSLRQVGFGGDLTAVGFQALDNFSSDSVYHTAIGSRALSSYIDSASNGGAGNTAVGGLALPAHIRGGSNTAIGALAGQYLATGASNVFVGAGAGTVSFLDSGPIDGSILIGSSCHSNFSNVIAIGTNINATGPNRITLGNETLRAAIVSPEVTGSSTHTIKINIGGVEYRLLAIAS